MGELIRPGASPLPPEGGEVDAHLPHVFDYCRALLGRDDLAATIALAVLTSAHELLDNPHRLRAGLFALARRHALTLLPYTDQPPYKVPAATSTSARLPSEFIVAAFAELTSGDREILDLVYRHGIHPADLPGILAIPAEEAYRRLIYAEEEFLSLAADRAAGPGAVLDDIADLPLAALPAPDGDGRRHRRPAPTIDAALWRALARRRVRIAGAAVIPLVAICWGVVYLAAAGAAGSSHDAAVVPAYGASPPRQVATTPNPTPAASPPRNAPPAIPIALLLPVPRRSASQGVVLPPPMVGATPSQTTPPTTPPATTPPPTTPPPTTPPPPSAAPTS